MMFINKDFSGLSLEAIGLLVVLHKRMNIDDVHSSKVTKEAAREELLAKGFLKVKEVAE